MKTEMNLAGLASNIVLLLTFYYLGKSLGWLHAGHWLFQASLLWCLVWQQTWQRLELNRPHSNAPLFHRLGWANRLTLLRGGLIALAGGFLFQPAMTGLLSWIPGLLYGCAAILDRLDGFVARKSKHTSLLGAELDTVFDALGLIVAPLLAVGYGKIHWSYLSLSIAYYVFQWGLNLRRKRGLELYPLHPSMLRRALAGFQMGFIALVLLPIFPPHITMVCGFVFLLPVLTGFIVDWLVMTGRLQPSFQKLSHVADTLLLPLLRLIIVSGVLVRDGQSFLLTLNIQALGPLDSVIAYGLMIGAMLVLLGFAGRIGALLVLLSLSMQHSTAPMALLDYILLYTSAWVLLLGTGRFNIWRGDHIWINQQDGA